MDVTLKPIQALIENVGHVIVGKRTVIEMVVIALLCRGHVLLEDMPGTGKTMLARAIAQSMHSSMKRLQCTPDLLPSDITGVPIFNQQQCCFEFRPGPVFTNILLADEINRATPRAQSALLESMEEFSVSIDGETHLLPSLFMVLATQNPIDMAGTHVLPEAQLDRFFMRLSMGYPSLEQELVILQAQAKQHPIEQLMPIIHEPQILAAREAVKQIRMSDEVALYIARIAAACRQHPELKLGVSPRGSLALARGARGLAFLQQRDYVTPDMVKTMALPILAHRLIVRPQAAAQGKKAEQILADILNQLPPPA